MGRRLTLEIDGTPQDLELHRGAQGALTVEIEGQARRVELAPSGIAGLHRLRVDGRITDLHISRAGRGLRVTVGPHTHDVVVRRGGGRAEASFGGGELVISAPMSGVVTEVLVSEGVRVRHEEPLLVVVAMKMNNEIRSPLDAVVRTVHIAVGESVDQGARLVVLEAAEES